MEELTLILSAIFGFCLTFYLFIVTLRKSSSSCKGFPSTCKRFLFIIAHPDDESMFFGPTLVHLARNPKIQSLKLLCLSTGNYRNEGLTRKRELYSACIALGIKEEDITVLNYTKLKDDPRVRWREELLCEVLLHEIISTDTDAVVTFDRGGVSGHKNHTSVYNAMALLSLEKKLPRTLKIFTLQSVNLMRKYSAVLDVPVSYLVSNFAFVSSVSDWWTVQRAMTAHNSQYVWFRRSVSLKYNDS